MSLFVLPPAWPMTATARLAHLLQHLLLRAQQCARRTPHASMLTMSAMAAVLQGSRKMVPTAGIRHTQSHAAATQQVAQALHLERSAYLLQQTSLRSLNALTVSRSLNRVHLSLHAYCTDVSMAMLQHALSPAVRVSPSLMSPARPSVPAAALQ